MNRRSMTCAKRACVKHSQVKSINPLLTWIMATSLAITLSAGCAKKPLAPRHLVTEIPSTAQQMFAGSQGSKSDFQLPSPTQIITDIKVENQTFTCNLRNAPLEEILKQISEQSGLQFVHRGRLHGRVSAKLKSMPLDQGISMLFEATPYQASLTDEVYLISYSESSDTVKPVVEEVFFQYIEVDHALEALRAAYDKVTEPAVGFGRLPGNNGIFVVAPPEHMDGILEFLQGMDREIPQLLIEGVVVEFFTTDLLEFGLSLAEGSKGEYSELNYSPGSPIAPLLSFLFKEDEQLMKQFRLEVDALAEEQKAHIVSRPYIVTRSGRQALIRSKEILTVRSEALDSGERLLSTDDIEAGTSMKILPTINPDKTITLSMELKQSEFVRGFGAVEAGVVARRLEDIASLSLNVKNGETIVLGGFVRSEGVETLGSLPLISRIPLLKHLFGNYEDIERESEVVFILTPHILPIDFQKFYERPLPTHDHHKTKNKTKETARPMTSETET